MGNCYVIVIDGLGVGAQEDSEQYGDEDQNTLGHVCEHTGCKLPNLRVVKQYRGYSVKCYEYKKIGGSVLLKKLLYYGIENNSI